MPRCTRWATGVVAAAVIAGGAAAQLAPLPALPKPPVTTPAVPKPPVVTVPVKTKKPVPPRGAVAVPKLPKAGKLPIVRTVTSVKQGALTATGTMPLPNAPLPSTALPATGLPNEVEAIRSSVSLDLPRTTSLVTRQVAHAGSTTHRLSGPAFVIDRSAAPPATLEAARKRRLQELVREESLVLETDAQGNPIVRGKLVLLNADESVLRRARARGFFVISNMVEPQLGVRFTELAVPRGLSAVQALRRLRSIVPGAQADFDHVYQPAGGALRPARAPAARGTAARPVIGMIDGGVGAHPALGAATIEQRGFAGPVAATGHGTAVASLLVGRHGAFQGAAQSASLAVADVYGGKRSAGSTSAIVWALGWLASKRPSVINISLVGPSNRLLAAAIKGVRARNIQIVAAVSNDGPASPPQFPASYPGVIAITGVDARGRALPEAGNAAHIDFAAPAAHMAAARPRNGYARVRGTSFAAPLAAGRLALLGSLQKLSAEARPGVGRVGRGIVCNSCRVEPERVRAN